MERPFHIPPVSKQFSLLTPKNVQTHQFGPYNPKHKAIKRIYLKFDTVNYKFVFARRKF